ncbi:hypothetical protein QJS10_CPB18g01135 [Acorus calamus]|uniref:Nucleoside phosphorylase domain-containing protein n=1 Tax=Acorus calamus TaxID=4465 RepID=A0AAV9CL37_ACOCL|nr:hypothetical protein QJS10_CPB18g01135 [Acorus calamus]
MTGLGMINAGIATQMLLDLFNVEGIVHYGTAGNANPSLNIGDVTIAQFWAHTALWNWQARIFCMGIDTIEEVFTVSGTPEERDHTFWVPVDSHYFELSKNLEVGGKIRIRESDENEFFDGDFMPVMKSERMIQSLSHNHSKGESCLNSTTCLKPPPRVVGHLGEHLPQQCRREKFGVSPFDMESALVANAVRVVAQFINLLR